MKTYKISSDTNPNIAVVEADSVRAALDFGAAQLKAVVMGVRMLDDGSARADVWTQGVGKFTLIATPAQ